MFDKDIRREDVQDLSSRDHVAAFFATLGYHTDARLAQSPPNIGITAESLARQITHLERIADQESLLQVYLVVADVGHSGRNAPPHCATAPVTT